MHNIFSNKNIDILVCPKTKKKLSELDTKIDQVKEHINNKNLLYQDGSAVSPNFESILYQKDEKRVYFVFDGVPVLLYDKSVFIENLNDFI